MRLRSPVRRGAVGVPGADGSGAANEIIAQRGAGAAPIIYMGRSSVTSEVDARLANYAFWLAYPRM